MTDLHPVPPPEPTPLLAPTAEDVRAMVAATNRRTLIGAVALLLLVVGVVWFTAGGRAASIDSKNSTKVALANNERQACISDRAAVEADAGHDRDDALGLALYDYFILGETEQARAQGETMKDAIARRIEASKARARDQVNRPVSEGGCGPVIDSLDDIPASR